MWSLDDACYHPHYGFHKSPSKLKPLIEPSEPVGNNGCDNSNGDLICYENFEIIDQENRRFRLKKWVGSGQFGQVYECVYVNPPSGQPKKYAVKISKSSNEALCQFNYESQALTYLKNYLEMYEQERMSVIEYSFIYMNHFCLIFELMGASLIKEIQENKFSGFPLVYVQSVLKNILPMLSSLSNLGLMHCDVKPENILKFGESFKLIDFGSCLFVANNSIFYVQSRFYRAPEVALKIPFDSKVDVWSLGCVAVELFLGLPLFPARSEVHLSSLIEQTIGKYPEHMYRQSPRRDKLFSNDGTIKSPTELCRDNDEDFATEFQPYFTKTKLLDILDSYETEGDENNGHNRELFIDLVNKMLKIDPEERISADSALNHPFFDIRFTS